MVANQMRRVADALPSETTLWFGLLCALELFAVVGYFRVTSAELTSVRYVLYPFVWINVGLYAVVGTRLVAASRRHRVAAAVVASTYFLLLAWLVGMVGLQSGGHELATGLSVRMRSPGWGPVVTYVTPSATMAVVPFRLVGYLSLAYLVYATVLESATASVGGVVGLVSCISCAAPLLSSLAASLTGSTTAIAATLFPFSLDVSTLIFVLTVALLYWRPGVSTRASA
ncbi:DUF7546 family protein [Haloarchaeobius sp. HRN-SO-5]|uniref:DUF7546 family protein n=1 Tax=Haloarchaeobius sp. HRN-SO-5 TaxID=3446118 RepID=UPI003EBBE3C0